MDIFLFLIFTAFAFVCFANVTDSLKAGVVTLPPWTFVLLVLGYIFVLGDMGIICHWIAEHFHG